MPEDDNYTWQGEVIHQAQPITHVAALRTDGPGGALTVTIGNVDLPAFVSGGVLYVQAPLPLIFQAFAEDFPAFCGDMEVRVSIAGRGSFPLDSDGRPVYGAELVESSVVPSGGQW